MKRLSPSFFSVGPAVAYLVAFVIFPLAFSAVVSFYYIDLPTGRWNFVGSQNYLELLDDSTFITSLGRTVMFVVSMVSVEIGLGLVLALILNSEMRGKRFFRIVFLFPISIGALTVGFIWRLIYHQSGPANYLLTLVGFGRVPWLGDVAIAPISIVLTDAWQWTPFMMLVLLAGLQSIPQDIYEVAVVDGASRWSILRYITLPMLSGIVAVAAIIRSIDAFKIFDIIYILTSGGPGTSTYVVSLYDYYQGFKSLNIGYAASMSWVLNFVLVIFFVVFVRTALRRR